MNQSNSYPTPSEIRYRLERIWLRRWFRKSILYLISIVFFLLLILFVFNSLNNLTGIKNLKDYLNKHMLGRPELTISSLEINNANPDLINQINAILQLSFPISSINIDINYLQKIINDIDSVESSNIRVIDNGVLVVDVVERTPVAVHRENDQLTLIDLRGNKINNLFSRADRNDLPLIVGYNANLNVKEALEIYQFFLSDVARVRGLMRIGERRWDIILNNKKRIKLPEKNPKKSLQNFLTSELENLISADHFSIIDLRFKNRVILRKKNVVNKTQ